MAPRRFDVPLYYKPMMGEDPKAWINNVMRRRRRIYGRPTGIRTIPYAIRKVLSATIAVTGDEAKAPPDECEVTQKDLWFPDPLKMARCLISKPSIREMGEDEEKIYCGMIYGPEYTDYEHKSQKKIAKTIRRLLIKHLPIMKDILEKRRKKDKEQIRIDFKAWLERGKKAILKEKKEELLQRERDAIKNIHMKREKVLSDLKGKMEQEIKEVNDAKKEYLKSTYEFQIKWFLKDNEQIYTNKMNLYSTIWNKILQNLSERAKRKISQLNLNSNQTIDKETVQAIVEKENYNNNLTVMKFYDQVEKVISQLKSKVLAEELHIQQERRRGEKIEGLVKAWDSLLEHVIKLFDKVVVYGFQGKPGECNYFLDRGIIEKIKKSLNEADETGSAISKLPDKINDIDRSEEICPELSRDRSVLSVDMTVDPPDQDLIIKLNLFQVKKLIEETTCQVLVKPLQVAAFMDHKLVELKSFSDGKSGEESSYILDKLSDAYTLLEKMLFKSEKRNLDTSATEEVPYTIETDPELTNRVNYLIKCYRSNPDNMRALTNV